MYEAYLGRVVYFSDSGKGDGRKHGLKNGLSLNKKAKGKKEKAFNAIQAT